MMRFIRVARISQKWRVWKHYKNITLRSFIQYHRDEIEFHNVPNMGTNRKKLPTVYAINVREIVALIAAKGWKLHRFRQKRSIVDRDESPLIIGNRPHSNMRRYHLQDLKSFAGVPGVYKLFHQGDLVYIGKANNIRHRISQHSSGAKIDFFETFSVTIIYDSSERTNFEEYSIAKFMPKYNKYIPMCAVIPLDRRVARRMQRYEKPG